MTSAVPALTATGVRVEPSILRGVDLTLWRGETVALLGPNGAGKSTLLAALAGLIRPDAGAVTLAAGGRVAAALQSPALAGRTALANVELALRWWGGCTRAEGRARALEALAAVNAAHLADRPARALSGGEARRVHLARALAVNPSVLLLDEPFTGLDPGTRAELLGDTEAVLRSPDRATLIVVHDRAEAWALADRVIVVMAGRVAADGTVDAVLRTPPTEDVADFVGFHGRVVLGEDVVRLRASDVRLAAAAGLPGTVLRRVPLQDGMSLVVEVAGGQVEVVAPNPAPVVGDLVRVELTGGMRYPIC